MHSLYNQKEENYAGNLALCGKPLKKMCTVPTSHSIPTNVSTDGSATAAIAAMPKKTAGQSNNHGQLKVNPVKIAAIVVGDVAAMRRNIGNVGEMAFAVRRIGESVVEKMREFEKIVRVIGKFRHQNLVKLRGFYWETMRSL
ncbi:hypothetical protein L2E82_45180 [Cichorium intybus]|uniref:Uncharacterized protein n=1 Tax=Cichorium intybus TaxID=13427 RepID=A0ACB8ZRU9_CICIN|nr:hypothetical protein L2E82_45180 [Cichorium intybus]